MKSYGWGEIVLRSLVVEGSLLSAVLQRLDASPLPSIAENLLLAALDSDDEMRRVVAGAARPRPETPAAGGAPAVAGEPGAPSRVYLRSVTVEGFRGIGPPSTLTLEPGPGLTVVCGRNGSGKSSFAEALEVLLTGSTRRWEDRSAVWRDGWRSMHWPEAAVTAELVVEGAKAPAMVARRWGETRQIDDSVVSVQGAGEPRSGMERLGWGDALISYRPFLSHAELETLLAQPKDLYDQLNRLLGLEDLELAAKRLGGARRDAERDGKEAKAGRPELVAALGESVDDRAAAARELLGKKDVDFDALDLLAAGVVPGDGGDLAILDGLRSVHIPSPAAVAQAVGALRSAAAAIEEATTSAAAGAAATARLLESALVHFAVHGPGDCPVCGQRDRLDDTWRTATEAQVAELRSTAEALRLAQQAGENADRLGRTLVAAVPGVLAQAGVVDVDGVPALTAWEAWAGVPEGPTDAAGLRALAAHVEGSFPALGLAVEGVVESARAEFDQRQDRWAPVAERIREWTALARRGEAAKSTVAAIKAAEAWLRDANDGLRNEQLRPFADRTVELWAQLRQESNVDLLRMRLAGAANRSHVDFDVTVDGQVASGLGVMSQGEVNALALSVFLPRATSPASPLRFVIIDDPVQAMDPAKVDGLARVLAEVADTHQVVVFTHDTRLPAAIRSLGLPARILQVLRRADSAVEVHPAGDPCEMLLADAGALAAGGTVPAVVAARVVPGICRVALEEVCIELTRRRRLGRGDAHDELEAALGSPTKLVTWLALAVLDDDRQGGGVYAWLNTRVGTWATDTVKACNEGAHGGHPGGMGSLVGDTRRLVERLRAVVS